MASGYLLSPTNSGDLIAELAARAPEMGANSGLWPGLTIYRFTGPVGPSWEEIQSLSLCIVAQGRKRVTVDGNTYGYDPFHYLVLGSHLHFQAEILEASVSRPFLSFVLQIDPALPPGGRAAAGQRPEPCPRLLQPVPPSGIGPGRG